MGCRKLTYNQAEEVLEEKPKSFLRVVKGKSEAEKKCINYYPFGSIMPGRTFSSSSTYRYGFNGMEKDDEVKGNGNSLDFGARIYDSRVGRWLSLDPSMASYPEWSPYNFSIDNPIRFNDPDGKDPRWGQLANLGTILLRIQKYYENNPKMKERGLRVQYSRLSGHFQVNRSYTRDKDGKLIDTDPNANDNKARYMYTNLYGWVDFNHFFKVLNWMQVNESLGEFIAVNIEDFQGPQLSQWAYEDYSSNAVGVIFYKMYGEQLNNGDIELVDAMTQFFETYTEPMEPEDAPNYDQIPHIINRETHVTWKNRDRPLTGKELKEVFGNAYEGYSDETKKKIEEAHDQIENAPDPEPNN